ncbi:CDP-alcohol phosphatidyltransferase family protein [Candidatus Giovannonibacteria bacterium]|nr:CDP-alcohol phosphatidyltransferase family protein [Candidatus Giovannonibacteria bacterium]
MTAIIVFGLAILFGYFVMPHLIRRENLFLFLENTTSFETIWRDRKLRFLTDRMDFISPNGVTVIGFFLVFLLYLLYSWQAPMLVIFFVTMIAGFSDALDGSLARNSNRVTNLGAILDVTRDILLGVVISFILMDSGYLWFQFVLWFFMGWIFLGLIRMLEFRISDGKFLPSEDDYKFALDRMRFTFYILGVLLLLLFEVWFGFTVIGDTLIIFSIALSWVSLVFHSMHLKILRDTGGNKTPAGQVPTATPKNFHSGA